MNNPFQKASRSQVFLKLAITGPTGSGKTFSSLRLLLGLLGINPQNYLLPDTKKIAFEDTENESASLYAPPDGSEPDFKTTFPFDVMPIAPPFAPEAFSKGIESAVAAGYGAVVIDSASHLWRGILKYKGEIDARGGNQWTNWRDPDKKFQEAIDAVLQSKIHVVFCMRSKMEYEQVKDGNKSAIVKVGLAPIMKDDLEYEFTSVLDIQMDHKAKASKDRSGLFPDDKIFQITEDTGKQIAAWLKTATPKPEPVAPPKDATVVLTDEAAREKNIAKLSEMLSKNVPEGHEESDFVSAWCKMVSTKIGDGETRHALAQFTLDQLRGPVWDHRAWAVSEVHRIAKEVAKCEVSE